MIKEGERDATLKYLAAAPKNRLAINSYTDGMPPCSFLLLLLGSSDAVKQSRHRARTSVATPTTSSSAQSRSPTHTSTTSVIPVA